MSNNTTQRFGSWEIFSVREEITNKSHDPHKEEVHDLIEIQHLSNRVSNSHSVIRECYLKNHESLQLAVRSRMCAGEVFDAKSRPVQRRIVRFQHVHDRAPNMMCDFSTCTTAHVTCCGRLVLVSSRFSLLRSCVKWQINTLQNPQPKGKRSSRK